VWKYHKETPCVGILSKQNHFSFTNIRDQDSGTSERGEEVEKLCGRVKMCKYCVHMYINGKMKPVETIPGMGGEQ
jgi:hypothetical protein